LPLISDADDLQSQLCRHLLKTVCTDVVNTVFNVYATEAMVSLPDSKDFTAEVHCALFVCLTRFNINRDD